MTLIFLKITFYEAVKRKKLFYQICMNTNSISFPIVAAVFCTICKLLVFFLFPTFALRVGTLWEKVTQSL